MYNIKLPSKSWDVQLPTSTGELNPDFNRSREVFSTLNGPSFQTLRYFSFSSMRTPEGKKVGNLSLKGKEGWERHPQAFNVWYIYPHFGDFCMVDVGKYTIMLNVWTWIDHDRFTHRKFVNSWCLFCL